MQVAKVLLKCDEFNFVQMNVALIIQEGDYIVLRGMKNEIFRENTKEQIKNGEIMHLIFKCFSNPDTRSYE